MLLQHAKHQLLFGISWVELKFIKKYTANRRYRSILCLCLFEYLQMSGATTVAELI